LFLYGFSLGGLVASLLSISKPDLLDYLLLESPALNINENTLKSWQRPLAKILVKIPGIRLIKLGGDKERLSYSRDRSRLLGHDIDTRDNGGISMRTLCSMLYAQETIERKIHLQVKPTFVALAGSDHTVCSKKVAQMVSGWDAAIKVYPNAFHGVHEELPETLANYKHDLKEWMLKQLIIRPVTPRFSEEITKKIVKSKCFRFNY